MKETFEKGHYHDFAKSLAAANAEVQSYYAGESGDRQPVHTVYGGAQLFKKSTSARMGEMAVENFKAYAPSPKTLETVFGLEANLAKTVYDRVALKLQEEAVEDFRIDFEDGFGVRPDSEEDQTAIHAAKELAEAWAEDSAPPFTGIRIKSFGEETRVRALRTLDRFLTALIKATDGSIHPNFVVTLPKITHKKHVEVLVKALKVMEKSHDLPQGSLKFEIMVETPQTVIAPSGKALLTEIVEIGGHRLKAAHFGTYDYTASMNITADMQTMDHPACDFARHMMKVTLAGTGVWLSDGATNIMPIPPYQEPGSDKEIAANIASIHRAWSLSFSHVRHSLKNGFYQGWDLHPAQLPVRYIALYSFFLESLSGATKRLRNFVDHAAKATLAGDVFDDAATGQGLLNFFLRALNCGAINHEDVNETGLTPAEVQTRSFIKIIRGRQK